MNSFRQLLRSQKHVFPKFLSHTVIYTFTYVNDFLISGGVVTAGGNALSIEALLDILLVLYDECQTPALRREKRISEFIDFGKNIYL